MEAVIENIKRIRKQKGYSHEYVAHELDLSQVAYSKLEKNETKLTVERLYKLAEILEVEVAELLDIKYSNQFNQTTKDNSTGYLQQIDNFYQENKEQNQKIIELYEARLQDKEKIISHLESLVK
uniref:helix-turn-helix domain-containing protein n=1 Tax=Gelidibacter sp. TaxID=2018083 RepID=UPI00404B090B